jgi:hypothetical protein
MVIHAATLTIMNDIPVAMNKNRIHRLKHTECELPHSSSNAVLVKLATNAIIIAPQYGPDMNVVTSPAVTVSIDSVTGDAIL